MPKNKNASERYLIIDSLLHSYQGKSYTQSELLLVVNERLMDQGLPAVICLKLIVDVISFSRLCVISQ